MMKVLLILLTVLETLLNTLETRTLQTDFTLTITEGAVQPMSYPGRLTMQGEKFLLSAMGQEMAYDGLTLYSYQADIEELTLSEPMAEELMMTNPFLFARALYKECHVSERKSKDGKSDIITLIPKNQSAGVQRMVMTVRDGLPQSGEIVEGKTTTRVVLSHPRWADGVTTWSINHPGVYINDLR